MRNLPLIDAPYHIYKLEVFDILLIVAIPSPFIVLGVILNPLLLIPFPFIMLISAYKIRNAKKDKAFGYMQRKVYALSSKLREMFGFEGRKFYP